MRIRLKDLPQSQLPYCHYALAHYRKRIATGYAWPSDELREEYSSSGYQAYGCSQDIPGDGKYPPTSVPYDQLHRLTEILVPSPDARIVVCI